MYSKRVSKEILKTEHKNKKKHDEKKVEKKSYWIELLETLSLFHFHWVLPPFS